MESLSKDVSETLGRILASTVSKYFRDENHRKEFEDWYFEKYGIQYRWKV